MRWYLDIIAQVTLILYDVWYYTSPISEYCLLMINLNCDVLYIYIYYTRSNKYSY